MDLKELKELQNEQFEIMKDVIEVCQKHNINYFMAYGSLLGTIRHNGTIPWDYDIDLFMKRTDFELFAQHLSELSDFLIKKNMYTNDTSKVSLFRLYKKGTRIYHKDHYDSSRIDGIHIDIFILDYAKYYPTFLKKIVIGISKYLSLGQLDKFERRWLYDHFKENVIKRLIVASSKFISVICSTSTIQILLHHLLVSKKQTQSLLCLLDLRVNAYWESQWFDKKIIREYEGVSVNVPKEYDVVLKKMYGDYMKLPPEKDRFTSYMNDIIIDFGRKKQI